MRLPRDTLCLIPLPSLNTVRGDFPFRQKFESQDCLTNLTPNARLVAGDALTPKCKFQEALVQQYINIAEHEVYRAAATWVYPTYGIIQFNKTVRVFVLTLMVLVDLNGTSTLWCD